MRNKAIRHKHEKVKFNNVLSKHIDNLTGLFEAIYADKASAFGMYSRCNLAGLHISAVARKSDNNEHIFNS